MSELEKIIRKSVSKAVIIGSESRDEVIEKFDINPEPMRKKAEKFIPRDMRPRKKSSS